MSNTKHKNQQPPATPPASEAPETAPPAPETAPPEAPSHEGAESETAVSAVPPGAPPAATSSELAVTPPAPSALAITSPLSDVMNINKPFDPHKSGAIESLIELFPTDARYLKQLKPVTDDELQAVMQKLPEAQRLAFQEALDRMSPVKLGSHARKRDGLTIFDVRINHGTGNDETKPKGTPEGALYSTDSRMLATSDRDLAAVHKVPEFLDCFIIIDRKGNTYWPPKDDAGNVIKVEGEETRGNSPICRSVDAEKGDKFGSCAACPVRPFVNGKNPGDDECRGELVIYLVPRDLSGVYRMVFNGTNTKAGRELVKKYAAWRTNWDHPFSIKTHKEVSKTDPKQRWFLVEGGPQMSVGPTPEEREFLQALTRKIETEVYWPERRRIHLQALNATAPTVAVKANLAGLLASSQKGLPIVGQTVTNAPAPDLSKNNL